MTSTAKIIRPWEKTTSNSSGPIDELAALREQIKTLEVREKELVAIVKDMGEGEHEGSKCKACVQTVQQSRLDTNGLKAALPDEMIAKYTKTSDIVKVTIKALV